MKGIIYVSSIIIFKFCGCLACTRPVTFVSVIMQDMLCGLAHGTDNRHNKLDCSVLGWGVICNVKVNTSVEERGLDEVVACNCFFIELANYLYCTWF